MTTRITGSMMTRSLLSDINDISTRQDATRRQMSSGKQINKASDDPYAAAFFTLVEELGLIPA